MAKAVLSAMDALRIKEAHVLGNSLGAQIATVMAMQAPKRIQSMILIAQNPPVEVCHPAHRVFIVSTG